MFVIQVMDDKGFVGYVKSISSRNPIGFSITKILVNAKAYKTLDLVMGDIDSCARSSFGTGYRFTYIQRLK